MTDGPSPSAPQDARPAAQRLLDHWQSLGWKPEAVCTSDDLDAWEAEHVVRLPEDLRLFLMGFERKGCHRPDLNTLVAMWGLESYECAEVAPARADPTLRYFAIGDHCMDACRYYIGLAATVRDQQPVVVYFGFHQAEETIATSFSELAGLFLTNPEQLEFW